MTSKQVHIISVINAKNITTQTIDGEEHIVVNNVVPIVDNVVMNGGLYPAEEIEGSYQSMEGKLMPLGHPTSNGKYISANSPTAINNFHVGAWFVNVQKNGEIVSGEMRVNKRVAETTDGGKKLVERLIAMQNNQTTEPIHVSTGLNLYKTNARGESKGKSYTWIARNMQFDHIAILLDQPGAATPEEGVGIFVNSKGEEETVEVVNLQESKDCTRGNIFQRIKWFFTGNSSEFSFETIARLLDDYLNKDRQKDDPWRWIDSVFPDHFIYNDKQKKFKQYYTIDSNGEVSFSKDPVEVVKKVYFTELTTNGDSAMKEKIIAALKAANFSTEGKTDEELLTAYNALQAKPPVGSPEANNEALAKLIREEVANALKPILDEANSAKVKVINEKREAVKAKFGLDDAAVNALEGAALDALFAKTQETAGIAGGGMAANQEADQWAGYTLNPAEGK